MAFNSVAYLIFYVTILALSWAFVGFPRFRIQLVLVASLYFYASNNYWLLLLLLASTHVDYVAAKIKGAGVVTRAQCIEFFGGTGSYCDKYPEQ